MFWQQSQGFKPSVGRSNCISSENDWIVRYLDGVFKKRSRSYYGCSKLCCSFNLWSVRRAWRQLHKLKELRDWFYLFLGAKNGGSTAARRFAVWIWIWLCFSGVWWISLLNLSATFTRTSSYEMWTQILQEMSEWSHKEVRNIYIDQHAFKCGKYYRKLP